MEKYRETKTQENGEMIPTPNSSYQISLQRLKVFAVQELPLNSALKLVLLAEPDMIDRQTFLSRLPIFLLLLKIEKGRT